MADTNGKKVTIQVGDHELKFVVDTKAYNSYLNEMLPNNKVAPSENFLKRCLADQSQAELLESFCDQGLALNLASTVSEEFVPALEIKVKK